MVNARRLCAIVAAVVALLFLQQQSLAQPGLGVAANIDPGSTPAPQNVELLDRPADAGEAFLIVFDIEPAGTLFILPEIRVDGRWYPTHGAPINIEDIATVSASPQWFGRKPANPDSYVIPIESYLLSRAVAAPPAAAAEPEPAEDTTDVEVAPDSDEPPPTDLPAEPEQSAVEEPPVDGEPLEPEADPLAEVDPATGVTLDGTDANVEAADPAAATAPTADAAAAPAEPESSPLVPGTEYEVRLIVTTTDATAVYTAGTAVPVENMFKYGAGITLGLSIVFAIMVLTGIMLARRHPERLFMRRIAGLDAVDEAIGRATEMGKPVMQINGLDPLSTLSTIAAVNILGQIARKVAHFDSRLMVPSFDAVVMTVSQEVVKQAYLETGRPDAYRQDDIFFVTDQQFSYTAAVCGIMLRERPAANFFLGYFYAESLLLAETGQSTGAIQIAGTDSQSQLPFFITTCDYTLIGEELYAASAYLAREPMLLGSLKALDVAKVMVMALILLGALLATTGVSWLTELFTPVS